MESVVCMQDGPLELGVMESVEPVQNEETADSQVSSNDIRPIGSISWLTFLLVTHTVSNIVVTSQLCLKSRPALFKVQLSDLHHMLLTQLI